MYNEKVMEIFKNPHNVGEMKDANAVGQVGNVSCGDIMKIYLKINENEVIEDASFKTFGCAAAIVSSSIATDLIKGMTIKEALEFDNDKIIEVVGELPVHKVHCSVLAKEAIEDAIKNYYKRKAKEEKLAKEGKLPAKSAKKTQPKKVENNKVEVKKEEKTQEKTENITSALAKLKETKSAKKVETINNKLEKEEIKDEQPLETKSLLSSLKIAKINKQLETKNSKPTKQEVKAQKKEEKQAKKDKVAKEKSAKKVDKNFKNLNERLNKLNFK